MRHTKCYIGCICVSHLKNRHLLWCMSLWQGRGLSRHLSSESVLTELMSKLSRVKLVLIAQPKTTKYPQPLKQPQIKEKLPEQI